MDWLFNIINIPLGYLVRFCYSFTHNYALALLVFAVLIKIILFPLGIKQQKNQVRQAQLRPKEMAIRKKYAGRDDKATQQKLNEEIMDFYQKENFNPMGGCLPMVIELVIVWALYIVITKPLEYICMLSTDVVSQLTAESLKLGYTVEKASQIDLVTAIRNNFSSFTGILPSSFTVDKLPDFTSWGGLDLSKTPSFQNPSWLLVIPLLTLVLTFLSMRITRKFTYTPPEGQDAAKSMQIMDWTMPLFSVFITFTVPSVIGLYWLYQNVLSALKQFILYKMYPIPTFTEDEMRAAEREVNGKVSKNKAAQGRSLHHIDDDDISSERRKLDAAKKAPAGGKPALKDESDRVGPDGKPLPGAIKDEIDPEKKPVRSLHHIDDEEVAAAKAAEKAAMEKQKAQAAAEKSRLRSQELNQKKQAAKDKTLEAQASDPDASSAADSDSASDAGGDSPSDDSVR